MDVALVTADPSAGAHRFGHGKCVDGPRVVYFNPTRSLLPPPRGAVDYDDSPPTRDSVVFRLFVKCAPN